MTLKWTASRTIGPFIKNPAQRKSDVYAVRYNYPLSLPLLALQCGFLILNFGFFMVVTSGAVCYLSGDISPL
jgi:hypothetical protein